MNPLWTNAKWGGPPGPRPTPTSACCWCSSMLEVAGPGGPTRTRGSAPPIKSDELQVRFAPGTEPQAPPAVGFEPRTSPIGIAGSKEVDERFIRKLKRK